MKMLKIGFSVLLSSLFVVSCGNNSKVQDNQSASSVDSTGMEKVTAVINGHEYSYDVVSGATKEVKDPNQEPLEYQEKLSKMFWSGKPAVGYVEGDYYHADTLFGGYLALVDLVKKDGKVVHVELDEVAPNDYYAPEWGGLAKRLSGYAFFQAESDRTTKTLVTLINAFTYFEHQILTENRMMGEFKTVKGASNSMRRAFIPMIERLAPLTEKPSGKYYQALTKDLGDGLSARIEVIKEGGKIVKVKYDEFFADTQDEIKDANLKSFYRQSKYYSPAYNKMTKADFKAFVDAINSSVVSGQNLLKLSNSVKSNQTFKQELSNYQALANELLAKIG